MNFSPVAFQGDLAKKKIYPTLWWLYRDNLLPSDTKFIGYARSKLSVAELKEKCRQYMKVELVIESTSVVYRFFSFLSNALHR